MKRIKSILAIIGIILLVGMYGATLFFAITDDQKTMSYFKASFFLTCAIPIMIYGFQLVYRLLNNRDK